MTFVLVVEDEESISDALAYMLRKEGFEVVEWLRGQLFEDMVVVVFHGSERVQGVEKPVAVGTDFFPARTAHGLTQRNLVKLLEEYLSHK